MKIIICHKLINYAIYILQAGVIEMFAKVRGDVDTALSEKLPEFIPEGMLSFPPHAQTHQEKLCTKS